MIATVRRSGLVLLAAWSLAAVPRASADDAVEVQIRLTATPDDDFVSWAPTRCQIRLKPGAAQDMTVVLTNDPPLAPQPGRTVPLDGDVVFAASVAPGATATLDTLQLVLPANGDFVPFVVAGKFGRPSEKLGDAVIQVHQGGASGPVVGTQPLMVRVRKSLATLTPFERDELLRAVSDLKLADGGVAFQTILRMHNLAVNAAPPFGNVPDQAHKNAAFVAWHRAFLLQFERALQAGHPHVSLHYWRQEFPSVPPSSGDVPDSVSVFSDFFVGTNAESDGLVDVHFDPSNFLFGWDINGTALFRAGFPRDDTTWVKPEATVLNFTRFRNVSNPSSGDSFSFFLEDNPHNDGHGWVGGWMQDCRTSPQDPIFYLFHSDIDRYWARWQWSQGRFGNDGSDPRDFAPNDHYATGSSVPFGHHLKDTMWPWDGKTGLASPPDPQANRPPSAPGSPFKKSSLPGLWPAADATPTVATMIDYLGTLGTGLPLGFSYDEVPYGVRNQAASPASGGGLLATAPKPNRVGTFVNKRAPVDERLDAARAHEGGAPQEHLDRLIEVLRDRSEPDAVRHTALRMLGRSRDARAVTEGARIVSDPESGGPPLRARAARSLGVLGMFTEMGRSRLPEIRDALRTATGDEQASVRHAAMSALISTGDAAAADILKRAIEQPPGGKFSRAQAVRYLSLSGPGVHSNAIRPTLKDADPEVRVAALRSLGGDQSSAADRRALMLDRRQPVPVRAAALQSLMPSDPAFLDDALALLRDPDEDPTLRAQAAGGLRVYATRNAAALPAGRLAAISDELARLKETDNAPLRRSISTAEDQIRQTLKSKGTPR